MKRPEARKLSGSLTSAEVPETHARSLAWKDEGMPAAIDLADVGQTDSSAVALLLEWLSWARARDRTLEFLNPPEDLKIIARLSQADEILGWKEQSS